MVVNRSRKPGGGDEPQRFDSSTLVSHQIGPFGYQLGCRSFKAAKRGQHPHGLPHSACRVRLAGRGRCPLKAVTRVQIPHATQSPRQVDSGQDYESRLRRSNRLGGTE